MVRNLLIFTGNGKGKSTAAFGLALRAAGHGQRVLIIQFLKADDSTGEVVSLRRKLDIEVRQTGLGFVPAQDHPDYPAHRQAAQQGWQQARRELLVGDCELLILDEICGAIAHRLIDEEQLLAALDGGRENLNLVLTGRHASLALIERADTVTEMVAIKHARAAGIGARQGIEF